jgi:hypothetical protein
MKVEESESEPENIIIANKGKAAPKAAQKADPKKKAQNDSDDTSFDEEEFKPKAGATKAAVQKKPAVAAKKAVYSLKSSN